MSEAQNEDSPAAKWRREAELRENLAKSLHEVGPEAARPYAEALAELLGDESQGSLVVWADIWAVRGRLDKAIEIGERDIEKCFSTLEERTSLIGDVSDHREDVEDLLDAHYFQAKRYLDLGSPGAAKTTMLEAQQLSSRYGVPFDETLQDFFNELCEGE
jgi:hypothetical protein